MSGSETDNPQQRRQEPLLTEPAKGTKPGLFNRARTSLDSVLKTLQMDDEEAEEHMDEKPLSQGDQEFLEMLEEVE